MEEQRTVKMIEIDFKCPKCNEGHLRPTGVCFPTNPAQYPHKCNKEGCDYGQTFSIMYPYTTYK